VTLIMMRESVESRWVLVLSSKGTTFSIAHAYDPSFHYVSVVSLKGVVSVVSLNGGVIGERSSPRGGVSAQQEGNLGSPRGFL
jgi:hypothetical protein